MAKTKTVFYCTQCGYESSGWLGKCPGCGEWNSFVEEPSAAPSKNSRRSTPDGYGIPKDTKPVKIDEIDCEKEGMRDSSGIGELDRVMGGGIVRGSMVLVAGDPGIGKSTLMLMISGYLASSAGTVLYVSGEESESQIKLRARRLGVENGELFIYNETSVGSIISQIDAVKPSYIILDSIQTLEDDSLSSAPGSVSQVREITAKFMRIAKVLGITVFIVGHVTKEGSIAGPRVLEHMVDTVLYFEGERHLSYRILRAVKNRFGSTNEIGVFEMRDSGLAEIENPSSALLEGRPRGVSGTAVTAAMEGSRPMMLEIQALISGSSLNMPRRMCAGPDYNRVSLLLAVLEKRAGYGLGKCDAFVNVVGGIRLNEPASDLAVCAAIMSSFRGIPLPSDAVYIGEVGLTGEIRSVTHIEKRVNESIRLGFNRIYLPSGNKKNITAAARDGQLIFVDSIRTLSDEIGSSGAEEGGILNEYR